MCSSQSTTDTPMDRQPTSCPPDVKRRIPRITVLKRETDTYWDSSSFEPTYTNGEGIEINCSSGDADVLIDTGCLYSITGKYIKIWSKRYQFTSQEASNLRLYMIDPKHLT